jgi:hypothetical protein
VEQGAAGADRLRASEARFEVLCGALRSFAEAAGDSKRLLEVVARNLASVVKDGCVVRLVGEGGWLEAVAVHLPLEGRGLPPDVIAALRADVALPHHVTEPGAAGRVLETGERFSRRVSISSGCGPTRRRRSRARTTCSASTARSWSRCATAAAR